MGYLYTIINRTMKNNISVFEFLKKFPTEESCEQWIKDARWPRGIFCPFCNNHRIYRLETQKRFKCGNCRKQFTVRTGSVLAESKVPLQKWLMTTWILTSHTKGISSVQLAKTLGVTQKTAWFLAHRIREAFSQGGGRMFTGVVEVEEPQQPILKVDKSLAHLVGTVHPSDCVKFMNEKIPAESISCIVTSPPYNLKNSTGNGMKAGTKSGKWANNPLQNGYDGHHDNMPHAEYVKWQRDCLTAMMRVLKNDGVIFYNHKWRVQGGLLQDRHDIVDGFPVRQIIIWKRAGGINFNAGYFLPTFEVIYMICKPEFKLADGANKMTDVWEIPQAKNPDHPAPFPIELASRCIEASPGGVVLDPFMGSGTTAIAALSHDRDWIGIELSKEYCKLAESKISQYNKLVYA